ncbi:MAG: AbrB family transcriptional regulator [Clostridia bacterium]|nr:AbrB family transcriptional regulator [Clostridia bacterium]
MKTTGIVRRVDEVGRVVLPIEIRSVLGIESRDAVEIQTEDDRIVIKKYHPSCVFCGSTENVIEFREKLLCRSCIAEISKLKR